MEKARTASRFAALVAGATAFLGLACGEGTTGPVGDRSASLFSDQITLETFEETIIDAPQRVEIKLLPGTLTAREVEIEESEELSNREEIESRATAINAGGGSGQLTLALGDLVIDFDASTEFRKEGGGELSMDAFVALVQDALAAGESPPVEAKRPPPAEPQAPDDPTFFATRLELDDEADDPEIEINIDADNFLVNDAPPPDAFLRVLGLSIEITEGVTELERESDRADQEIEFEGIVASVDTQAETVTLVDGTVIRIVDGTEIKSDDDDDELGSLAEVVAALDQGLLVEAEGEGILEGTEPTTIIAKEIEFEVEDDADDISGEAKFEGLVASVDEGAGTVTLTNGTLIRIVDGTRIDNDDDDELGSLAEVAEALEQGQAVEAEGKGVVEQMSPRVIVASRIEFEIEDDD